ncbi:MAG: YraN family protein [Azospira sp.]|jgi:putative endonuclease|nr:YraN family protein [Azospira sp.]
MPDDTTDGARAETLAARFLTARGLSVLARNYRVRGGEIDLVCADHGTLVFVEVRLRRRGDFGGAAASVTAAKRRRLVLAARHYLARTHRPEAPCRFDCVLLSGLNAADIDWVRNAFGTDDA